MVSTARTDDTGSNYGDFHRAVYPGLTFATSVELFDPAKGTRLGPAGVREKLGVMPDQVADFLALAGDAVDDIPGVKGVGNKTAAALLQEMGSLERIYERLDEVETLSIRGAKSVARKLEAGREQAELSRKLTGLVEDAPAEGEVADWELHGADESALRPLLESLGMESYAGRVRNWRS